MNKYSIRYSTQYKKDRKNLNNDELNLSDKIVEKLARGEVLDEIYKDHSLSGDFKGFRECHIKSNLLLVYRIFESELLLARLGTHQAIFKKY